ncbi:reverse transcriptase [Trichonephila clavipes]|nr:reverse transcriptase [Trichonephila clavipes]
MVLLAVCEGSLAVGKNATNYDDKFLAVCEATTQLFAGPAPVKVVFFIDSQAVILALSSNTPTDCLNIIQCRTKITELISYGGTVTLHWIPSHIGISGNERAESTQLEVSWTLRRAKSIVSTYIDKYTAMTQKAKSLGKPWETLMTEGPLPQRLETAEAVARFRLTTGHDFWGVYSTGLAGLLRRPAHSAVMPERMATICPYALDSMNTRLPILSVWEARRQMVKKSSTGIG